METREIEILSEKILHLGGTYWKGVQTLPKPTADYFIRHGWAKCTQTGEQGERIPGAAKPIEVHDVVMEVSTDDA